MERELGKDLEQGKKRVAFLMDNCDAVEEKGYMKPFTPEELARMKESLSETDIEINDIEEEKTAAMKDFKARLEPLTTERKKTLDGLKKKAEFVTERCLKFIDVDPQAWILQRERRPYREPAGVQRRITNNTFPNRKKNRY